MVKKDGFMALTNTTVDVNVLNHVNPQSAVFYFAFQYM